jgi:hypothetical protein
MASINSKERTRKLRRKRERVKTFKEMKNLSKLNW